VILAGGSLRTAPPLPPDALVVAADSGYDHRTTLGLDVDVLVGDMDSISPNGLDHATRTGVAIERSEPDKDATDLELAIEAARTRGATKFILVGGEGGRFAQLLGNALALTRRDLDGLDLTWHTPTGTVRVATTERAVELTEPPGTRVSLIPVGDAMDVTTDGLRWMLDGDDLPSGTSRGISNEVTHSPATVSVGSGRVLVIVEVDPS
jgi:thiamine pyrophosphokinase